MRRTIDRARRLNELFLKAFKEKYPDQFFHTGGYVDHLHIATDWTKYSRSDPISDLMKWMDQIKKSEESRLSHFLKESKLLWYDGVYYGFKEMAMIRPNIERLLKRLGKRGKKRGGKQQNFQQKQQWRQQERRMRRQPRPGR